ncbi:hypothetical protein [Nocardioides sp. YIM 152588]|uniref:hypothetical protein n=1 Tax=Nocardioides sp. YIM 152588 TaxID=3158259 RepID=UPI0032E3AC10
MTSGPDARPRHRAERASARPAAHRLGAAALGLVLALSIVAATAVAGLLAPEPDGTTPAPASAPAPAAEEAEDRAEVAALRVLRRWDRARARAWMRDDPAALARLYWPGSEAGRRDLAMLAAWRGRGVRVRGMRMQVLELRLRARSSRRMVLVVTDRLTGAVAVGVDGGGRALPRDGASSRRLELVRRGGRWLLAAAYDLPARPVASTSETSASASS